MIPRWRDGLADALLRQATARLARARPECSRAVLAAAAVADWTAALLPTPAPGACP